MLDGTYKVSLATPIGPINGTITLITNGNTIQGTLETMGMKNTFNGMKIANDKCKFSDVLNTPMGKINYNAVCSVFNNTIELDISTSQGNFKITGKKIK